jgi:mRNA interferase HicA
VKSSEFKRWLAAQGATFRPGGRGSHLKVELNAKTTVLPTHSKDLKKGWFTQSRKTWG